MGMRSILCCISIIIVPLSSCFILSFLMRSKLIDGEERSNLNEDERLDLTDDVRQKAYSDLETFKLGMLVDHSEEERKANGFVLHGFNEFTSEKIGFWRKLPDARNPICKGKHYSDELPIASIVICFYNEAWSTLLRSIHSIFANTPSHLLKEIVLVDDYSSLGHLKGPLDKYIEANFTKLQIVHSPVRLGLIRARLEGAKHTSGKILVFLDSHIEVGENWLPPLLDRIKTNRKNVVVPIVDTIEAETMIFKPANLMRGGFTWSLLHNWEHLLQEVEDEVKKTANPYITPTMPGGLFAMERDYFYELGEYDKDMNIWGGENMEISFRIWLCGGRLEIVPCSRIGHVFRVFRPYGSPDGEDTTTRNAARVADVWLDEYKKHFFDVRPAARSMDYGDVSDRIALRKKLKCRSFKWFLKNVYPEQIVPGTNTKAKNTYYRKTKAGEETGLSQGYIMNERMNLCVVPHNHMKPPVKQSTFSLIDCSLISIEPVHFSLTKEHHLQLLGTRLCVETKHGKSPHDIVQLSKCHGDGGPQTWLQLIQEDHEVLYNPSSGKCMSIGSYEEDEQLSLDLCSSPTAQGFRIGS